MPNWIAGSLAVAMSAAMLTAASPASAEVLYPWCAYYVEDDGGGSYNCGFVSFDQCMATVRGVGGYCQENPAYPGRAERPAKIRKAHRKKKH